MQSKGTATILKSDAALAEGNARLAKLNAILSNVTALSAGPCAGHTPQLNAMQARGSANVVESSDARRGIRNDCHVKPSDVDYSAKEAEGSALKTSHRGEKSTFRLNCLNERCLYYCRLMACKPMSRYCRWRAVCLSVRLAVCHDRVLRPNGDR